MVRKVKARVLEVGAFLPYGFFEDMLGDSAVKMGVPPVEFYRDMLQHNLGGESIASYSVCRVWPRPMTIGGAECHSRCGECIMPLDGDVMIHVAPATNPARPLAPEAFQVFRVPQSTMVILRPGVWHGAPYALKQESVSALIGLPERAYAKDCIYKNFEEGEKLEIEL
jgi:ureidoglycolate lyase